MIVAVGPYHYDTALGPLHVSVELDEAQLAILVGALQSLNVHPRWVTDVELSEGEVIVHGFAHLNGKHIIDLETGMTVKRTWRSNASN